MSAEPNEISLGVIVWITFFNPIFGDLFLLYFILQRYKSMALWKFRIKDMIGGHRWSKSGALMQSNNRRITNS